MVGVDLWCATFRVCVFGTAEVGHMILESSQYTKLLESLADYSIEVIHNIVGILGHLAATG